VDDFVAEVAGKEVLISTNSLSDAVTVAFIAEDDALWNSLSYGRNRY